MAQTKVIDGYVRVSRVGKRDKKDESYQTVEQQKAAINRWIEQNGYTLGEVVIEEDVSGKLKASERGLEILIKRTEAGKSAGIVVQWQDRLTRGRASEAASIWERLQAAGARFVAVDDGVDSANEGSELFFMIHAALSREQWKVYAKRWRLAKKNAVELGLYTANITPVGYHRVEKRLVPDPVMGPVVTELFKLRTEGASWLKLTHYFIDNGGPFNTTRQRVQNMLENTTYLGWSRNGEYVNKKAHDPLVSERIFDKVQAMKRGTPRVQTSNAAAESLLGGLALVRCEGCNYAMQTTQAGAKGNLFYRCAHSTCPARSSAKVADLDAEVVERLESYWRTYTFAHVIRESSNGDQIEADIIEARDKLADAQHRLDKFNANKKLYLDSMTPQEFSAVLNELKDDAAEYQLALDMAKSEQAEPPSHENVSDLWGNWSHQDRKEWLSRNLSVVLIKRAGGKKPKHVSERMALGMSDGLWLHREAGWSAEAFAEPQSFMNIVRRRNAKKDAGTRATN